MHWRPIKFPKHIITTSRNFKRQHQVLFFQELGELLQSGYSIAHSLDILAAATMDNLVSNCQCAFKSRGAVARCVRSNRFTSHFVTN